MNKVGQVGVAMSYLEGVATKTAKKGSNNFKIFKGLKQSETSVSKGLKIISRTFSLAAVLESD